MSILKLKQLIINRTLFDKIRNAKIGGDWYDHEVLFLVCTVLEKVILRGSAMPSISFTVKVR